MWNIEKKMGHESREGKLGKRKEVWGRGRGDK
jgi:hypothetical protein